MRDELASSVESLAVPGAGSAAMLLRLDSLSARANLIGYFVASRLGVRAWQQRCGVRVSGPMLQRGHRFQLRPDSVDWLMLHPWHERETRRLLSRRLGSEGRRGVFVDVGAHCGSFSIDLERHFERVVSVEPWPQNLEALTRNLRLNALEERVAVVPRAAGETEGACRLYLSKDDTHSIVKRGDESGWIEVPMTTLDRVAIDLGIAPSSVRLLKIDVEGAEPRVLAGAHALLAEGSPIVVAEANTESASDALLKVLGSYGYRRTAVLDERNHIFER